jgi:hypothetical protein
MSLAKKTYLKYVKDETTLPRSFFRLKKFINETEDHGNKRLCFLEEFSSVDNQRVEIKYSQFSNIAADITWI